MLCSQLGKRLVSLPFHHHLPLAAAMSGSSGRHHSQTLSPDGSGRGKSGSRVSLVQAGSYQRLERNIHSTPSALPPLPPHVTTLLNTVSDILTAAHWGVIDRQSKSFCSGYCEFSEADRISFLSALAAEYHVNHHDVLLRSRELLDGSSHIEHNDAIMLRLEEKLGDALQPEYSRLFRKIGLIEGGVKFLVDFRADILHCLTIRQVNVDAVNLKAMNICLKELLSLWFSVGFLQLQRITWRSPCEILQKISEYEAIHPMKHWTDLKRRVGPYRRCFVFTHHSMPSEPIVVLHTALTREISSSIQAIVSQQRLSRMESVTDYSSQFHRDIVEDPEKVTTAIFYSITSTQRGLQGIELGNYLIKKVVLSLQTEFPNMQQFSSLSPIPGFRDWLLMEIGKSLSSHHTVPLLTDQEKSAIQDALGGEEPLLVALKSAFVDHSWVSNDDLVMLLKEPLLRMCARYLFLEKHRGYALNSVAHFHLKNGAVLWRINWLADRTQRGLSSSCGLMVNYRYILDDTENNSMAYLDNQAITCSEDVNNLLSQLTYSNL